MRVVGYCSGVCPSDFPVWIGRIGFEMHKCLQWCLDMITYPVVCLAPWLSLKILLLDATLVLCSCGEGLCLCLFFVVCLFMFRKHSCLKFPVFLRKSCLTECRACQKMLLGMIWWGEYCTTLLWSILPLVSFCLLFNLINMKEKTGTDCGFAVSRCY